MKHKPETIDSMIDYSLYLVTDRELSLGRTNAEIVSSAVRGGVCCVQLREKNLGTRAFIREAHILKKLLEPISIPLIINDRVDIALAVNADGIHLGQSDMRIEDARRLLGDSKIIGISAECLDHAIEAERQGADYIGVSPVYATATKPDTAAPLGLEGIGSIRRHVRLPLIGIGGINSTNIADVIGAGADGIALVSAIVSAPSPENAARSLKRRIVSARGLKNDCN
jgi:thiamine-phosphate pyrophosphorylase